MTRTLSENLYKAAKTAYILETRMSKKAKSLPVLHYYRLYTQEGQIHIQAVDSSGETWELVTSETPARGDNEFDNDTRRVWRQVVTS